MLKTLFFGTPDFAVPSFRSVLQNSQVQGVVTQPDRPRGRGQKLSPCPVKAEALAAGLPVFDPVSLKKTSPELETLKDFLNQNDFDLFIVVAYGNLLPEWVLSIPRLGCINGHASLLPNWRGAAPIQRAIEAGDSETGVCLQKMVMALDAGDVLTERREPIHADTTSADLFLRLADVGSELLTHYLHQIQNAQELVGTPQNENGVTLAQKISKEEGHWSPSWSAKETHCRVRAFIPWPSVKCRLGELGEIKILKTSLIPKEQPHTIRAGELYIQDKQVFVGTNVRSGEKLSLRLETIQAAGRGPRQAFEFLAASGLTEMRLLEIAP